MRFILFFILPFSIFSQVQLKLDLVQKHNYCGGAKPPQEILEQYEKPWPYANKHLVIVSNCGKIDSVITNENGVLDLKLKRGSYKIYESWRYYKKTPDGSPLNSYDLNCLKESWKKVDITIVATKKKKETKIELDEAFCQHAIPCLTNPHLPE